LLLQSISNFQVVLAIVVSCVVNSVSDLAVSCTM